MTTTLERTVPSTERRSGGGLRGAISFEWTKFWTVRSTWSSLLSSILLVAGLGVILGLSAKASGDNGIDVTAPAPHVAVQAIILAQIAVIALAALVITSEYASGAIRTSLQAVPVRGRLLFAKALVLAVVTFVLGVVLSLIGTFTTAPLMGDYGDFTSTEAVQTALGIGGYLCALSLLVLGIGTLLRSAAGTITTTIVLMLALPPILQISGVEWLSDVSDYLPSVAGQVLMVQDTEPYGVGVAAAVLTGWALVVLIAGYVTLRRRDA